MYPMREFLKGPDQRQKQDLLQVRKLFLSFNAQDEYYCKCLDEIVVLLGTGMRVGEFCGLAISDLDLEKRRIRVERQLVKQTGGVYHVEKTKTESGRRYISMSDEVYQSLYNILANRPRCKNEIMADGHTGFLLLGENGQPKVAYHIYYVIQRLREKYNKRHVIPMPLIMLHVFRHTFCTNMANAGMDHKSLQYIMGHSDLQPPSISTPTTAMRRRRNTWPGSCPLARPNSPQSGSGLHGESCAKCCTKLRGDVKGNGCLCTTIF